MNEIKLRLQTLVVFLVAVKEKVLLGHNCETDIIMLFGVIKLLSYFIFLQEKEAKHGVSQCTGHKQRSFSRPS